MASGHLEIESEPVEATYSDVDEMLRHAGPAIVLLPGDSTAGGSLLLILTATGNQLSLLSPEDRVRKVSAASVRRALCAEIETPWEAGLQPVLVDAGVPDESRDHALRIIMQEQLSQVRIQGIWILRPLPGASFLKQVRPARLIPPFLVMLSLFLITQLSEIGQWWLIGRGSLQGRFELIWLWAWALILVTTVPLQILMELAQRTFSTGAESVLRQRLMYGILRLFPEEIRHQGMGQFMGMVMEAESLEMLAIGGGYGVLLSIVRLVSAASILALGAGGWRHAAVLGSGCYSRPRSLSFTSVVAWIGRAVIVA